MVSNNVITASTYQKLNLVMYVIRYIMFLSMAIYIKGMIGMRAEDLDGTMEGIKIDMSVHMICITLEVVILVEVEVEVRILH